MVVLFYLFQMICSRVAPSSQALVNKIASLLEDRFYVPVLRSEDNCVQPTIGEPFSPSSPPVSFHVHFYYIFLSFTKNVIIFKTKKLNIIHGSSF